jgi:uncharacterized protein YciI
MFIIDLTYKTPLDVIEKYIDEHRTFLEEYYAQQKFISSGPKIPRSGGIIIAQCDHKLELMRIIKKDPFYKNNLADYTITEFNPTKGLFQSVLPDAE